jgi:hypothetical protein
MSDPRYEEAKQGSSLAQWLLAPVAETKADIQQPAHKQP